MKKNQENNYEYLKKKSNENNETIATIIRTSEKILSFSDIITLDSKSPAIDSKLLYSKIIDNYQSFGGNIIRTFDKKSNIRLQIYELIKENGGFRIGLNNLLYILFKYKIIVQDLKTQL